MDSVIYYFTGTGNSLKVARELSDNLGGTQLIRISSNIFGSMDNAQYKKVGIIFPVYYYGLPLMVQRFAERLVLSPDTYVYTVATCGASVGSAIKQLNEILTRNGVALSSAFTIRMPDNYQILFAPPSPKKQNKFFANANRQIDQIAEIVKKSEGVPFEERNSIVSKLLGGILSKSFKPNNKDKNFWTDDSCNGCGICSRVCPSDNIFIKEGKPTWLHQCEHCLACLQWCPKHSLQYRRGTLKRERYQHPDVKLSELFIKTDNGK